MDPISMLRVLFPTQSERFAARLPTAQAEVPRAATFGPSVILSGALRTPDHLTKNDIDPSLLAQFGGGTGSSTNSDAASQLTKLTDFWGALIGEDKSHAVARFRQAVQVGDDSVVETQGGASVTAGSNSTVTASGEFDASINVGNRSMVAGGDGNDSVIGGTNLAARGGAGNDFIMAGDGAVVSGDSGNDSVTVGRYSIVDGGTGNDVITAGAGSTISGGEGNDTLRLERSTADTGSYDPAVVSGGAGDDAITIRNTTADIEYRSGDGSDIIQGDLGTSMLKLTDLRQSDVSFQKVATGDGSHDLIVTISGSSDTITIKGADVGTNGNFSINLRGGTELVVSDIMAGL